ncbi:MAG TPA: heme-dependent oxidative N-demethylase subunit alpha family protein, partial [Opitutus sp.]|nr:heme-dependent oxidative N-demethylase subunit alpha family protein [Opitutus sp.]
FTELCREWEVLTSPPTMEGGFDRPIGDASLKGLGGTLEPDFVFLSADVEGNFRMRGGVVCFPSGWALQEKMGHTLEFIHGVVPGLNPLLGSPINQFLSKLKPGVAFQRDNWGIAATDELNQHPSRCLPAPSLPVAFDQLWLRVEHQALIALPRSNGVLFGIRIVNHRLDSLVNERSVVPGLTRALLSMPEPVAAYKRLETVRGPLAEALKTVT